MRFNLARPQVFAVTRPISRRPGVLAGMGEALDTGFNFTDPYAMPDMPAVQDSTPISWDTSAGSTDAPANYDPFNFDYANYTRPPPVNPAPVTTPPAEPSTDWMSIFGTSAKALATITPAVTGIMAQQQNAKAQQAANDLALAQAKLAASRSGVAASSGLPSWVLPVVGGGVLLLAAGFFLTRMPRSRPAPAVATNPRRRRRRSHR